MNLLEKLYALLAKPERTIKYGVPDGESADPLLCITSGESEKTQTALGGVKEVKYPTAILTVYSADYLAGYNLLQAVKSEIKNAQKHTTVIFHDSDKASSREGDRYAFGAKFKIIE